MELKHGEIETEYAVDTCLNRTFMELKLISLVLARTRFLVLIEPLWNWNSDSTTKHHEHHRLNRTFMELKQIYNKTQEMAEVVLIEPLWNWNLIEPLLTIKLAKS